ncbi:hypothetical protein E6R62_34960 [Streptomyces sp. A1136]|nr:hypothetical protein E6R62_34960 [Streptomyces sp. A1136]
MTTSMACYWDEEATWFYFEVDAEGPVIRGVRGSLGDCPPPDCIPARLTARPCGGFWASSRHYPDPSPHRPSRRHRSAP